jgi:hypothetical protein
MRKLLLVSLLLLPACLPSCDKAERKTTTPGGSRSIKSDRASDQLSRERLLAEENMREFREAAIVENKPPTAVALEEAFQSASQIIQGKKLTPESEGAERLEANLTLMLRNGDGRIYDLISQLPPGNYSESIVHNAFMRVPFSDLKSVFDSCAPIKEKDLHRAAINGAASSLLMEARRGGTAVNVTRIDIEQLRAVGLQQLPAMIVQGVRVGSLDASDIVAEINEQSNSTLITALSELPAEKAKEIFIEALKQEKTVDSGSTWQLARNLFHENPSEAVSWFSQFPPDTAARGTRGVVKEWMTADPLAASAFVGGMPVGPPKDAAVAVIVSDCLSNGDQEAAADWAKGISDMALREKIQAQIQNSKQP